MYALYYFCAKTKSGSTMRIGHLEEFLSSDCDVYFYVRPFKIFSRLVAIAGRDCKDEEIKVCLENSLEARNLQFIVEPEDDSFLLKASLLIMYGLLLWKFSNLFSFV